MAAQTPSKQLFDLLVTKNYDPECLTAMGKPSPDPGEADVFSFDYTAESGNDYGTVVIMLADDNDMQVYFGDNLGKGMDSEDKSDWFDFLYELKNFATKNLLSFSPKNLNRLRYSMQGQAAIKEGIFESWSGTKTTSWNGRPTEARLMIKHKRPLGENDARFRYVESLFIETAEGERYKLPFTKLSGGRAMVEHVRNGGKVYDARGQHITEMVNEINVISRFRRANHGKVFEGDTAQLVEQTNFYYESLQKTLKGMSHARGYTSYFESWNPNIITEEEAVVEGLKHLFVTQSLDSRIEDALPLLARIQQGNVMNEANIFEAWVNNLAEGTWATPDTPEKQSKLVELLSKEFPVGPDATNATEQLYDLLGDDELFDQLENLSTQDPDADCRQIVMNRMDMLSSDPDIRAVIDAVQIDPTAEMNPAEPTDAGMSANPDDAQIPTNESDLEDIESIGGDSSDEFMASVMTNQQGDEIQENDLDAILRIAGVPAEENKSIDYKPEVKEGMLGTLVGATGGALAAGPAGARIGAVVGDNAQDMLNKNNSEDLPEEKLCNMTEDGEKCPVHGVEECWGTAAIPPSGGATLESKEEPFMSRIKTLAGIMVR
jgi:outer membrane lipoprotein SlyB